jgi:hypothetical protein
MAWLQLTVTGALALLVLVLAVLTLRLRGRVGQLERQLVVGSSSSDPQWSPEPGPGSHSRSLDEPDRTQYVITQVGEPVLPVDREPVPTVSAPVFADIVARETVVQTASLVHGLRRALSPETRNRIRFHMRQEVKRSRKQRRTELREVRREWAARQRVAMGADERPEGSAA